MITPAHQTKGVGQLVHSFNGTCTFSLAQSDDGTANGTSLWQAGQALALYFALSLKPPKHGAAAVELGSGIGLTALAVASLGYSVLATDIPHVHDAVLSKNISTNRHNLPPNSGSISSMIVDWLNFTSVSDDLPQSHHAPSLVFTADTIYSPHLVTPLLRTMHAISLPARAHCYLCIERRDPALVDTALREASDVWGFVVSRVSQRKLVQALRKGGVSDEALNAGDWDDLEIWKLVHPRSAKETEIAPNSL